MSENSRNSIPGPDDIVRYVLPNGAVLLIRENFDAQSVVIAGSFAAGAITEPREKHGLATLTARALTRGTKNYDFNAFNETLESSGMSLDFSSGRTLTVVSGKALAEDLPALLKLMGEALRQPTFPDEHIELIKGETITGLKYSQQDTRYMAGKTFRQLIYPPDHIYHRGATGEIETVSALTAQDAREFHARQYGPGRMILTIVGAVKAADALADVEKILADWENPAQNTDIDRIKEDVPCLQKIELQTVTLPGKSQSDIVMGVPGPTRFAENFHPANLVNNILGVFGMYGRLGATVREKQGLAYYCYSNVEGGLGPGAWRVIAGVNPANVKQAIDSIRVELDNIIDNPVSEQDLKDNKDYMINRLPLRLESNESVAGHMLAMERYGLGLDYLRTYADTIQKLTVEQLQAAMQHYWQKDAFGLAVAGPELTDKLI